MTLAEAYRVLGLPENATLEDVHRAYKEESNAWHPDRFTAGSKMHDRAQEKLKQLNEARAVLKEHLAGGPRNSGTADSRAEANRPDASILFQADVTYMGSDPRLDRSSIPLLNRRPMTVVVTPEGILLSFPTESGGKDWIAYPRKTIVDLSQHTRHWCAADVIYDVASFVAHMTAPNQVRFRTTDPERILKHIAIRLKFQNEYIAEVFAKRVIENFCPVNVHKWVQERRAENVRKERERQEQRQAEERKRREEERQKRAQAERERQAHRRAQEQKRQEAEGQSSESSRPFPWAELFCYFGVPVAILLVLIMSAIFSPWTAAPRDSVDAARSPETNLEAPAMDSSNATAADPASAAAHVPPQTTVSEESVHETVLRIQRSVDQLSDAEVDELAARFSRLTDEQMSLFSPEYLFFVERVLERKAYGRNQR